MHDLKKRIANPAKEYRNDVRWWLVEGMHTDETLKREVKMLDEKGFGAAEFLAMGDYGVDVKRYGWGSEEFVHDSELILDETTARGLGASMTSGTNWSNANLNNIVPDDIAAAKELSFVAEPLKAGERYGKKLPRGKIVTENVHKQDLIAVVAMKDLGKVEGTVNRRILAKDGIVLTDKVKDGFLNWKAPDDGDYILFSIWIQGTGQTASPSNSVNYTINYIDKEGTEALIDYWNKSILTPSMRKTILDNKRVQLYMDSLELTTFANGGQFWGYCFLDEFKARRGYDLTPHLPLVFKYSGMMFNASTPYRYGCDDADFRKKLLNDLYQTMTDMYMEHVLCPIQTWLHSVGMTLRAEISYGLPFEISQPGKYVDGVETESLEFASQIDSYRGLAGTAHIYNRLFSSETGAILGENYKKTLNYYDQIIFTQFAAGVARTVLHGYASIVGSPEFTQWPGHEGMLPIFSERFNESQPAFRFYNDWNAMITRFQYLLRQGKPRVDIGMLRLDYMFNNMVMGFTPDGSDPYETTLMRTNKALYWQDTSLQNAGYTYDYFAPDLLKDAPCDGTFAPDGPGYQAIIVYQDALDYSCAKVLLEHAKKGLKVLFVNGVTETLSIGYDVTYPKAAATTPFNDGKDAELKKVIDEIKALDNCKEIDGAENALAALRELGVEPRVRFARQDRNILPFLRDEDGLKLAYFYNMMFTEKKAHTFTAEIEGAGVPYAIDCWTGDVEKVAAYAIKDGRTVLTITLKPGEARMYAVDTNEKPEGFIADTDACFALVKDGKTFIAANRSGRYSVTMPCGRVKQYDVTAPADIKIPAWELKVESWDAGKRVDIIEDRGLGYVTTETYYETDKTVIDAGTVKAESWKDIPAVGAEVSGVGFYTAKVTVPDNWADGTIAVLDIPTTSGEPAAVFVNGVKAPAVDMANPSVNITGLLKPGENEIKIEVTTTLTNRLIARGYYANMMQRMGMIMSDPTIFGEMHLGGNDPDPDAPGTAFGGEGGLFSTPFPAATLDYGVIGDVVIKTYGVTAI